MWSFEVARCKLQVAWKYFKTPATCHLLLATFLLASCGFHPMYGDNSAFGGNTPLAGNLVIDDIAGREGQIFRISLEDLLNPTGARSASPQYHLKIKLTKTLIPAVIKSDGTVQRYDVQFSSTFTLRDVVANKEVLKGNMNRTGSYNVATNANFATYEAGQDITERTLKEMAEDYVLRLSGYFTSVKEK